jgi:hypothetical protein
VASLFGEPSGGATFSPCRRYRYHLHRTWSPGPRIAFLMLNPSTADETEPDPTLTRCVGFARSWGCGGVDIVNLFGLVDRDPKVLRTARDPIGPENNSHVAAVARKAGRIVAAWGAFPGARDRANAMRLRLAVERVELLCLGVTKAGHPRHPLYLRADTQLVPWTNRA